VFTKGNLIFHSKDWYLTVGQVHLLSREYTLQQNAYLVVSIIIIKFLLTSEILVSETS